MSFGDNKEDPFIDLLITVTCGQSDLAKVTLSNFNGEFDMNRVKQGLLSSLMRWVLQS